MSNVILRQEFAGECLGVPGRYHNVIGPEEGGPIRNQKFGTAKRLIEGGIGVRAKLRFDDECGNGHATFSITGDLIEEGRWIGGGCIHDDIQEAFPEFRHLLKWHLTSTDGPMHYEANTVYHASNRDHWGLLKGEFRPQRDKATGLPLWKLDHSQPGYGFASAVPSAEAPTSAVWVQQGITGEGKERNLDAARRCAVWPDAPEDILTGDPEALRAALRQRLPALLEEFRRDMEACGFIYR